VFISAAIRKKQGSKEEMSIFGGWAGAEAEQL
jgi:hypothetical protein